MNPRRGDYGYDAPPALIGLMSIAILATILAVASWMTPAHRLSRRVTEAMRVLKPGGRLAIADVRATSLYARTLRSLGATAVVRGRLGWRFWYGIAMTLVTATKAG